MSDWSQFRGDRENSGRRRSIETPDRPEVVWTAEIPDLHDNQPVLDRDSIYVSSSRGLVYAFDRHTGHRRWVFEDAPAFDTVPVVIDGLVVVASQAGAVVALEADTGTVRWSGSVPGTVTAPPTLSDSVLFVGHSAGVSALEADTGSSLWVHETETAIVGAPATASGGGPASERVYVGLEDAELIALETETGEQSWTAPTNGTVVGGPTIVTGDGEGIHEERTDAPAAELSVTSISEPEDTGVNDRVYAADNDGLLLSVDAETGQSWFTYEIADSFTTAPTVVDDSVFVAASDGYLHITDTMFGKRKLRGWLFAKKGVKLDAVAVSAPSLVGDRLCLGDSSGSVYGIDVADPDFAWHYPLEAGVSSGPAVATDALYVGTDDGRLQCLSWREEASNWF